MVDKEKQQELALAILEKCKEFGCQGPEDSAELIACATLIILNNISNFIGSSFEEVRQAYIKGLSEAEFN